MPAASPGNGKRRQRAAPFRDLAAALRADIARGHWPVGSRLPTAAELARTHGVGTNTVRRAIEQLVDERIVETRRGSGARIIAIPVPDAPSSSVGLIVPMNRHYDAVIDSIEHELRFAGYSLWLACTNYEPAAELAMAREYVASGVDGLIVVPTVHEGGDAIAHLNEFANLGVPYVFAERRPVDPPVGAACRGSAFVCSDIAEGVIEAIHHLREGGHARIGYLGLPGTPHSAEVFAGYQHGLEQFGLERIEAAVLHRNPWTEADFVAYAQLVAEQRLDAVYCSSDRNAALLLPQLRRAGLAVPTDIAVATFNDIVADIADVALTTVAPARAEVGALAARALVQAMRTKDAPVVRTLVVPRLIVRASTW